MQKSCRLWFILAVILLIPGLLCLTWRPIRFGTVFFGALAVGCAGEGLCVRYAERHKAARVLARIGCALFVLFLISFVWIQGLILSGEHADPEAANADYLLVLGAQIYADRPSATLASRLDTAADFLEAHPDTQAILCGGQGDDEPMTESHMMARYLTETCGIDPARLLIEDRSRNTIQNIANAKDAFSLENDRCAVLTSEFHLARARRLMAHAGLDPVGVPAPTPYAALRLVCHLREYCSTLGLILSGRYF